MTTPESEPYTSSRLTEGDVIKGRYQILRRIGKGGFADVYEAQQVSDGLGVAIKVLHVVHGDENQQRMRTRFKREAELVARLDHPDIVSLFDFGVLEDGRMFLVLELLIGRTLEQELLEEGPMEPTRAIPLMVQCLRALQSAHDLGIVHRDLKPSNLFVDSADGPHRLRVLDFGIAFADEDVQERLTRTGQIHGTPQYLSPEYIHSQIISPTLDVYQMGLILVEMHTGVPVVDASNSFKCLITHTRGKLGLPTDLVRSALGPVLHKALNVDHLDRYENAGAFADALALVDPSSIGPIDRLATSTNAESSPLYKVVAAPISTRRRTRDGSVDSGVRPQSDFRLLGSEDTTARQFTPPSGDWEVEEAVDAYGEGGWTTGSREAEPADEVVVPRSRMGWVVVLLLLVLLVGATVAAVLATGDNGTTERQANLTQPPDEPSKTLPVEPSTATREEPSPTTPVDVAVKASPDGATISRGDELLGTGAATITFENADADAVELIVTSPGYLPTVLRISPDDDDVTVELKPKRSRKPVVAAERRDDKPRKPKNRDRKRPPKGERATDKEPLPFFQ